MAIYSDDYMNGVSVSRPNDIYSLLNNTGAQGGASSLFGGLGGLAGGLAMAPATGGLSLIPSALSFIGGLLDDSEEQALKLQKKQLEEAKRSNLENEKQRRFEADKKFGFDAINQLTNTAFGAKKAYRNNIYNKTLHNVLTGRVAPLTQGAA